MLVYTYYKSITDPGVIDDDYVGEIKTMAASPHGIITVPANLKLLTEEKGL